MPTTPEPRFEVPPEYAEVYERAYRRAYEEGLGTEPTTGTALAPEPPSRGRRIAVPRQRVGGSTASASRRGGARRAGRPVADPEPQLVQPEPEPEPSPDAMAEPRRRRDQHQHHRGVPRTGSTLVPLLGLAALVLMLVAAAFVLGYVLGRAAGDSGTSTPRTPAASVAAPTTGATSATLPTTPAAYDGPTAPLRPDAVGSGCTASPGLSPQDVPVGYDASNVLDDDPATAWRCDTTAVGQVLDFTLPRNSQVVAVGLVPGYAVTDPATGVDLYAQNNRVTRVLWTFDDGSSVTQDLSPDTQDRSLRLLKIPETTSTHVSMKILAVDPGATGSTLISTVAFEMAAAGAQ